MELIQSFIYSISRVKLGLYEQRILLKVVEHAQSRIHGLLVKNDLSKWKHDFDNVQITVPIRDILSEDSQHYEAVRTSALRLMERKIEYFDSGTGSWFASPIIYNVRHDARSGVISFYVARRVFDCILDFTKGYRQYSLESALSIPSPYASRLYSLMCGQVSPIRYEIGELKRMFGVEDKYAQTADFIKKVIEPSRKTLDEMNYTSFTYSRVKSGQKVVALLFFPVRRDQQTKEQLVAKTSIGSYLTKELRIYLLQLGQFTLRELSSHKLLLDEFAKLPGCIEAINSIINRAVTGNKSKGYIINAMRSEVQEYKSKIVETNKTD